METAHDLVAAAKKRVQEISVQDAEQAIRAADVLVDVREADESQLSGDLFKCRYVGYVSNADIHSANLIGVPCSKAGFASFDQIEQNSYRLGSD